MGILVNGGVRYPTVLVERLEFAAGTPYETRLEHPGSAGQQVLAPEIAAVARGALGDVVAQGTAKGLLEFLKRDGGRHVVGGKTGTGDHRFDTYAPGGRLIESRVVNRAATFVFQIDDRFFGTVTAYVPGRAAARYQFTSALPVRLLGILLPELAPILDAPATAAPRTAGSPPGLARGVAAAVVDAPGALPVVAPATAAARGVAPARGVASPGAAPAAVTPSGTGGAVALPAVVSSAVSR